MPSKQLVTTNTPCGQLRTTCRSFGITMAMTSVPQAVQTATVNGLPVCRRLASNDCLLGSLRSRPLLVTVSNSAHFTLQCRMVVVENHFQ